MFFAKPLQRSNLCASHRQRRWLTHGELVRAPLRTSSIACLISSCVVMTSGPYRTTGSLIG